MSQPRLPGNLGDWLTVGMATELLDKPIEQTARFYELVKRKNLKLEKIGGTTLVSLPAFVRAAGLPASTGSPLPAGLASLPMSKIYSRVELADMLDISLSLLYFWVETGKIQRIDLSRWNSNALYCSDPVENTPLPMTINVFGYKLNMEMVDGQLNMDIYTPTETPHLYANCFYLEPSTTWYADRNKNPYIRIRSWRITEEG